jgi:hypothetical protein
MVCKICGRDVHLVIKLNHRVADLEAELKNASEKAKPASKEGDNKSSATTANMSHTFEIGLAIACAVILPCVLYNLQAVVHTPASFTFVLTVAGGGLTGLLAGMRGVRRWSVLCVLGLALAGLQVMVTCLTSAYAFHSYYQGQKAGYDQGLNEGRKEAPKGAPTDPQRQSTTVNLVLAPNVTGPSLDNSSTSQMPFRTIYSESVATRAWLEMTDSGIWLIEALPSFVLFAMFALVVGPHFGKAEGMAKLGLGRSLGTRIVRRRPDEGLANFESRLNQAGRIVSAAAHLIVVLVVFVSYCVSVARHPAAASNLEPPSVLSESK